MWCIGELTAEYRKRMYELLELYARPYDAREPVICLDEKSKQLLRETRPPLPAEPGELRKEDYEYERAGTCNIFVAVEPRGQRRSAEVTDRRTKIDFVAFVCRMLRRGYSHARKVHLVLDNLNTHMRESFEEVLGLKTAAIVLRRIEFHYTPKHASWLNMAEIEIGILQRQCLARCAAEQTVLATEVAAWQRRRNAQ
ncbi:MAG: IS630 family transposase, partial [Gammaproteobacteria bacterium]